MALIMAIGITSVLGIAGATAVAYSTSGAQESQQSGARQNAFSLAEAGINDSMAVLNLPTNNALDADTLNKCTSNETKYGTAGSNPTSISSWRHDSYANGTVDWCGTLNRSTAQWYLTSIGNMKNPGRSGYVTRTLQATVSVVPTLTQPLNNPSWNYIYATHTGSTCDQTLSNNVSGGSWMYIAGNLCLSQNVGIGATKLIVGGNLDLDNNAFVGDNTSMATRAEAYVGGNCRYQKVSSTWHACTGNQDGYNIFSKLSDGSTIGVNHTAPVVAPPAADFATWYENSIPGPASSCTTSTGTPPTFDNNYPTRDNSVTTPFDLTPTSSYTCRVGPGANTTVSSAMTAAQTTISVPSATGFPATGTFRIRVDDEDMTVTAGAGTTTWTVTRGVNSTACSDPRGRRICLLGQRRHERRDLLELDLEDADGQGHDLHRRQRQGLADRELQRPGDALPLRDDALQRQPLRGADRLELRLRQLEPELGDADDRGQRHRRPGRRDRQRPVLEQPVLPGRSLRRPATSSTATTRAPTGRSWARRSSSPTT